MVGISHRYSDIDISIEKNEVIIFTQALIYIFVGAERGRRSPLYTHNCTLTNCTHTALGVVHVLGTMNARGRDKKLIPFRRNAIKSFRIYKPLMRLSTNAIYLVNTRALIVKTLCLV